jgi:hypothetical protein
MPSVQYSEPPRDPGEWPVWRSTLKLVPERLSKDSDPAKVYDVKFFPWTLDDDPVFAYVWDRCAIVCRAAKGPKEYVFEELARFETARKDDNFNTLAWAMHPVDRRPLLCASGHKPLIHVYDVINKKSFRFLSGHGDVSVAF